MRYCGVHGSVTTHLVSASHAWRKSYASASPTHRIELEKGSNCEWLLSTHRSVLLHRETAWPHSYMSAGDAALIRQNVGALVQEQAGDKEGGKGRIQVLPVQWRKHLNLDVSLFSPCCGVRSNSKKVSVTLILIAEGPPSPPPRTRVASRCCWSSGGNRCNVPSCHLLPLAALVNIWRYIWHLIA